MISKLIPSDLSRILKEILGTPFKKNLKRNLRKVCVRFHSDIYVYLFLGTNDLEARLTNAEFLPRSIVVSRHKSPVGAGSSNHLDVLLGKSVGVFANFKVTENNRLSVDRHVELGGLVGAGQTLHGSALNTESDGLLLGSALDDSGSSSLALQPLLVGFLIATIGDFLRSTVEELHSKILSKKNEKIFSLKKKRKESKRQTPVLQDSDGAGGHFDEQTKKVTQAK